MKVSGKEVEESGFPSKYRLRSRLLIFKTSYKTLLAMIFITNSYKVSSNWKISFHLRKILYNAAP